MLWLTYLGNCKLFPTSGRGTLPMLNRYLRRFSHDALIEREQHDQYG